VQGGAVCCVVFCLFGGGKSVAVVVADFEIEYSCLFGKILSTVSIHSFREECLEIHLPNSTHTHNAQRQPCRIPRRS
jgi:hypothetical protein